MAGLYGGIEAGGTKFVCAIGSGCDLVEQIRIPTNDPQTTLAEVLHFFTPFKNELAGIGVASFGPVDLNPHSSTYGFITSTPKPGWAQTDLLGALRKHFDVPLAFDTDVNGAVLAEQTYGAAQGLENAVYFTVGTGIGGGVISNSQLLHGLVHPELGHILLPKHAQDNYKGHCPFHGDRCFEGLACGPAITIRWGEEASTLAPDHPAWDLQAWYLGAALCSTICAFSPQRIILGGGVMEMPGLIEKVRTQTLAQLNSYVKHAEIQQHIENYIVKPGLAERAGVIGALELIRQKLR